MAEEIKIKRSGLQTIRDILVVVSCILVLATLVLGFVVASSFISVIQEIKSDVGSLAQGDLSQILDADVDLPSPIKGDAEICGLIGDMLFTAQSGDFEGAISKISILKKEFNERGLGKREAVLINIEDALQSGNIIKAIPLTQALLESVEC